MGLEPPASPQRAPVTARLVTAADGVPLPPAPPGHAGPGAHGPSAASTGASTAKVVAVLGVVLVAVVALSAVGVGALAGLRDGTGNGEAAAGPAGVPVSECGAGDGWTCARLEVPARHGVPGDTVTITYAVHPASAPGPERRVMVFAAGGPGASGIEDARWLAGQLDPSVAAAVDLVAFDPRGTGESGHRDCIDAWADYRDSDAGTVATRTFVDDCIEQAKARGLDLATFGTAQVIEDIDRIRAALGVEQISLYGSSYGTVTAQAYAVAHPDRVVALVLDAPLDRTLAPADMWIEAARGYEAALQATFEACTADPDCRAAMPDPAATYGRLLAELDREGTIEVMATGPAGRLEDRSFTRPELDDMTSAAMYSTGERSSFLRALAAYEAGDARPIGRMIESLAFDGYGTFGYFATWCADVRVAPGADGDLDAYRRLAVEAGVAEGAAADTADALAPCVFWPAQPATWSAPSDPQVPTLVLSSSLDPVTRLKEARAMAARIPGARLVETRGGDHGHLGRACPQEHVARLLVDGALPDRTTSLCVVGAIDWFVPLAPRPATTASDAVVGVLWDLAATPELGYWDGEGTYRVGCAEGGTATLADVDGSWAKRVTLDGCSAVPGVAFDGEGTVDPWTLDTDVRLRADQGSVRLVWTRSSWRLTGTWDGSPVDQDY